MSVEQSSGFSQDKIVLFVAYQVESHQIISRSSNSARSLRTKWNVQFAYSISQGRPLHAQPCGCAIRTTDRPVRRSDRPHHVFTFHIFMVLKFALGHWTAAGFSSATGGRRTLPGDRITDRSMKFCSSRTFPGHE